MAKRILIADDSVTIQKAFAMTFAAEDITLMPARSADEGLSLARQMRPDLVIADGVMPGRSGYDLCAAIKAEPTLRGTLVYILSSAQQPYDEARGRQSGADGHFIKPFESTAIIENVRDAIARAVPVPAEASARGTTPLGRPPLRSTPPADDDYGEISVDVSPAREPARPAAPAYAAPAMRPAAMAPPPSSLPAGPGAAAASGSPAMRPSLIPGLRPGAIPTARPGTLPAGRPTGPGAAPPAQRPVAGRTLMGLPAANIPIPGSSRPGAASGHPGAMPQARPSILSPSRPAPAPAPSVPPPASPYTPLPAAPAAPALGAAVSTAVDARIAAFAAKGPEYEAIAKLSREVIEQIVWEIVPELAEAIIREHLEKRGRI